MKKTLKEGGNVWSDVEPFDQEQIPKMMSALSDIFQNTSIEPIAVGSGATPLPGKVSGDLDVVVDEEHVKNLFSAKDAKTARKALSDFVNKRGFETSQSGINVHVKLPVDGKFHQVDIMVTPNANKVAKFHTHSIPKGSPYKGVNKHLVISKLAKDKNLMWSAWQGLFARDSSGKKSDFITDDLDQIAQYLLGDDATASDLGSVENILAKLPKSKGAQLIQSLETDPNWKVVNEFEFKSAIANLLENIEVKYQRPQQKMLKERSMRLRISEGGWDSTATQGTVITPSVVKSALHTLEIYMRDFNKFLKSKGIPPVSIGTPTGSSAYYQVDPEDKVYGDIDLQIIVPELEQTKNMTTSQFQGFWYKLTDEFAKTTNPSYLHPDSAPGHPIIQAGKNGWLQVDFMPHTTSLAKWGAARTIPERGVKGLLHGNMFSVLGELLTMSIQHSGVQFKVRDNIKLPYSTTRSNYELVTVSTDPETFVLDIFNHIAELQGVVEPVISPMLKKHPGKDLTDVKISNLANAIKGLAESFALNDMYGKGDLKKYASADQFISEFKRIYAGKAQKDIDSAKRDKAQTPEAQARAEEDRKKIQQGLDMVLGYFS